MSKSRVLQCAGALALVLATATAHAQTPAPVLAPPPPPTTLDRPVPVPITMYTERPIGARPLVPQRVTANISAGTALNGGNTRSYAATVGGRFQLIRFPHQFTVEALGNLTAARNAFNNVHSTARNLVGRARYDIFLARNDALFAAMAPRYDPYAGLDLRLQNQAGYLRNLYAPTDSHRFWLEAGYDGTYDKFTQDPPPGAKAPDAPPPEHQFVHSARVFAGYSNMLTPMATLNLGLEFLYDLQDKKNTRVNSVVELTSSLSQRFKLSVLSRILYDQEPVTGKQKADYITTAQLVYTFDTFTPPAPCPVCDCSTEVANARAACTQPGGVVLPPADPSALPEPLPAQPAPG